MIAAIRKYWWLFLLCGVKLALHATVADNYGFHRDEYLYLAQAEHLGWGFIECPPLLAVVIAFFKLFGNGIIWLKMLPALFGIAIMVLIREMTADMGGKTFAQVLACTAFLLVPAYLRTHHLIQPTVLDQFFWVLLLMILIKLVKSGKPSWWYILAVTAGLGLLAKYSVIFPLAGIFAGILLTSERKWLRKKEPYIAFLIALVIVLPNIVWQYNHNFPVVNHMEELRRTQLVNVEPLNFIGFQFLMLFSASLVWVPGVLASFTRQFREFRILGWVYLAIIAILLVASGKPYYAIGIYPALLALGACWWEARLNKRRSLQVGLVAFILIANAVILPYGLPILPVNDMKRYCAWMADNAGLSGPLVWEDGTIHDLPQDYADMYGWEESVRNAADFYHTLDPDTQADCNFWGGSYGHAGALVYYREKYSLPNRIISFNGSFALWAPDTLNFRHQILIDDQRSFTSPYFNTVELVDSVADPNARDPGYVYWRTGMKGDSDSAWSTLIEENKYRWRRR